MFEIPFKKATFICSLLNVQSSDAQPFLCYVYCHFKVIPFIAQNLPTRCKSFTFHFALMHFFSVTMGTETPLSVLTYFKSFDVSCCFINILMFHNRQIQKEASHFPFFFILLEPVNMALNLIRKPRSF